MSGENKPDPPNVWQGKMLLVYPNGEQSDMETGAAGQPDPPTVPASRFQPLKRSPRELGSTGAAPLLLASHANHLCH
jgi:hypothetical protein